MRLLDQSSDVTFCTQAITFRFITRALRRPLAASRVLLAMQVILLPLSSPCLKDVAVFVAKNLAEMLDNVIVPI